ncbi:hypothetical protein GC096_35285 [Paenibacillus sp. LMG 31461]|uniref:Uncharacterized protein n=1 Tax=Paenibacillus plantarum TaxID=2654975 RepID=A0ABX1XLH3_9BACL|nr:hypothetical protein [Paenibacillus plantarum]NOU69284.1 hypothetical protein [Paenibacillus plantarum]
MKIFKCIDPEDLIKDYFSRGSKCPQTYDEYLNSDLFILGHCTSSTLLDSILMYGLLPDEKKEREYDDGVASDKESVYLSTIIDRYYFKRAVNKFAGEGILIVVKVCKANLYPDEAVMLLNNATKDLDLELYKSISSGQCKHKGPIPISHFEGIYNSVGDLIWKKNH